MPENTTATSGSRRNRTSFQPGKSGNPAGRPRGIPNKITVEIRQLALELVNNPDYRECFKQRLLKGKLAPAVEAMLWHYAFGKPKDELDLKVSAGDQELVELLLEGRRRAANWSANADTSSANKS
jgi:hypothetical protein